MVRVNLVRPSSLSDQHLIAEYDEILMLLAYARKYPSPEAIPKSYCLGKGHIKFFKNKLLYLKKRHEGLKKEMRKRGFKASKTISLKGFPKEMLNDWKPSAKDKEIIKKRIEWKLRKKPKFYRYYGEHKGLKFFLGKLSA